MATVESTWLAQRVIAGGDVKGRRRLVRQVVESRDMGYAAEVPDHTYYLLESEIPEALKQDGGMILTAVRQGWLDNALLYKVYTSNMGEVFMTDEALLANLMYPRIAISLIRLGTEAREKIKALALLKLDDAIADKTGSVLALQESMRHRIIE